MSTTDLPHLAEQFDDPAQQKEAGTLGMWLFLATEVLLFGGLFNAYFVYRHAYYPAFAEASGRLYAGLGTINTVVLLTSSLMMALAVHASHAGRRGATVVYLVLTILLGLTFLGIKAVEYHREYVDGVIPWLHWQPDRPFNDPGHAQLFMIFYFLMTLLHAVHMCIGIGLLSVMTWMARRGRFSAAYNNPLEVSGLYWHFIDIVWVFLLPTLYLVNPSLS